MKVAFHIETIVNSCVCIFGSTFLIWDETMARAAAIGLQAVVKDPFVQYYISLLLGSGVLRRVVTLTCET